MHLTNYAVNKHSELYVVANDPENVRASHKRGV